MTIRVLRSLFQRHFGFKDGGTGIFMIVMFSYDFFVAGSDHNKS